MTQKPKSWPGAGPIDQYLTPGSIVTELYEFPPTRSQRAKWVLEELEIEYSSHTVDLPARQQDTDAYRAIHPLGAVPALRADNYTMFESVAIVLQLLDEYPEKALAPAVGSPERALYYQWCVFAAAELDPAVMMFFDNTLRPLEHMRPPGTLHDAKLAARGRSDFEVRAEMLSNALGGRDYLLGADFSGADILIGHSCFMARHIALTKDGDYPTLDTYYERLRQRPARRRAYPDGS